MCRQFPHQLIFLNSTNRPSQCTLHRPACLQPRMECSWLDARQPRPGCQRCRSPPVGDHPRVAPAPCLRGHDPPGIARLPGASGIGAQEAGIGIGAWSYVRGERTEAPLPCRVKGHALSLGCWCGAAFLERAPLGIFPARRHTVPDQCAGPPRGHRARAVHDADAPTADRACGRRMLATADAAAAPYRQASCRLRSCVCDDGGPEKPSACQIEMHAIIIPSHALAQHPQRPRQPSLDV
jgi:hypothetical protein